jgi:predicted Rossmann fold nucleotide-binding protein DprA/Smf involved in DNA uptake
MSEGANATQMKRYIDMMYRDITATYTQRETQLSATTTRYIQRYAQLSTKYQQLLSAYNALRKIAEDSNISVSTALHLESVEASEADEVSTHSCSFLTVVAIDTFASESACM